MSGVRRQLILIAASGLAREVMVCRAVTERFDLLGVLDDDSTKRGRSFGATTVIGGIEDAASFSSVQFLVCSGNGQTRQRIVARLESCGVHEDRFASIVDPSAVVSPDCSVGAGSVVLSHVSLTADVEVGRHVVIMPQAVLTHGNRVGDYATICAGVALGGSVLVGTAAYLGMNASVRQNLRIGDRATLGMGSVLLSELPAGRSWAGVPAADLDDRSRSGFVEKCNDGPAVPAPYRGGSSS